VRALATQRERGSEPPSGTELQVPTFPVTLQLRQVPVVPSVQALLQQTPSVQNLLEHSAGPVQAAPLAFKPHELLMQVFGLTQSELAVQELRHKPVAALQV
jgi:hypothetical protein